MRGDGWVYPSHVGVGPSKDIPIFLEDVLKFLPFSWLHESANVCEAFAFL